MEGRQGTVTKSLRIPIGVIFLLITTFVLQSEGSPAGKSSKPQGDGGGSPQWITVHSGDHTMRVKATKPLPKPEEQKLGLFERVKARVQKVVAKQKEAYHRRHGGGKNETQQPVQPQPEPQAEPELKASDVSLAVAQKMQSFVGKNKGNQVVQAKKEEEPVEEEPDVEATTEKKSGGEDEPEVEAVTKATTGEEEAEEPAETGGTTEKAEEEPEEEEETTTTTTTTTEKPKSKSKSKPAAKKKPALDMLLED